MTNSFSNETLNVLLLITATLTLFNRLIAYAAWSATIQQNPTTYARFIAYVTWIENMRTLFTGERLAWKHG